MNETQTSTAEMDSTPSEPMSLGARLFNVFAAPGELFEGLRDTRPAQTNWLIPLLLSMTMAVVFCVVVFSQPDIVANVVSQQDSAFAVRVKAGKMTQDQADKASEMMAKWRTPKMMMTFGSILAVLFNAIALVVFSLLIWLLTDKILKGGVSFNKAFELCGLSSMIGVLGGLVTMLVVLLKSNVTAGPNAALLVGEFNQASYLHQFLAAINVMTIWYLVVLAIGAAKLSRRSFGAAAFWIFGTWAVIRFGLAAGSAWWAQFQSKL
jgi:Yip1 domain